MPAGERRTGPALLAAASTTVVVPPGFAFETTESGITLLYDASRDLDRVLAVLRRVPAPAPEPRPVPGAAGDPVGAVAR